MEEKQLLSDGSQTVNTLNELTILTVVQQLPITPPSKKQTAALDHVWRVATARLALLNNARNIANENDIKI